MIYQFTHYMVNDVVELEREFTLTVNKNTALTAHYEVIEVNVRIKNEEASDKKIIKTTLLIEEITICPGETVEISYNPNTDTLILRPT